MKNASNLTVIRTNEQHQKYFGEVQDLIGSAKELTQDEQNRLELLSVLIENYENTKYPIEAPDPIDAIKFRMHEKGLKQSDLTRYFGTSSRVSEILNRKRSLTVQMIREVSVGLGISAETLLGLSNTGLGSQKNEDVDWSKFPINEMKRRGWLGELIGKTKTSAENAVKDFLLDSDLQFGSVSFRRTIAGEAYSPTTQYALYAWLARVIQKAREQKINLGNFDPSILTSGFLSDLAQLSWFDNGPLLAVECLRQHGVAVIIEPHLKGTQLDGAALKDKDGIPIIALTLRYDRLDNFWFTLLHEVVHIWKHLDSQNAFLDDLEVSSEDQREAEANRLARDAFIPRLIWKRSDAFIFPSKESIDKLSRELKIHPAIIAGRLRKENKNYCIFNDLIGQGEVKKLFYNNDYEEEK